MSVNKEIKRVTTNTLQKMKENGEKISMITAYDFSFAKIFDAAGIDVILVGDSATFGHHPFYQALIQFFENQGTYHSAWEFMD